jgi:DNA-binding transcriptional regulator YhcF (GntR family)
MRQRRTTSETTNQGSQEGSSNLENLKFTMLEQQMQELITEYVNLGISYNTFIHVSTYQTCIPYDLY